MVVVEVRGARRSWILGTDDVVTCSNMWYASGCDSGSISDES